jgi:integrase|nr:MAG TPA: Integrase [Caudoviricetes sp.]
MGRSLKFAIHKTKRGKKTLYRIWLPARFSASGKITALYYETRDEAARDQMMLRDRFSQGELSDNNVLAPTQIREAKDAYGLLKDSGLGLSLLEAVRIGIEQQKARMAGLSVNELMTKYRDVVSADRGWSVKYEGNWRHYSSRFVEVFGNRNVADLEAHDIRVWLADSFKSATYFNSALGVLSPAFTWAVKQGIISRSPWSQIEKRKIVSSDSVDVFTVEEVKRLLASCRSYKDEEGHPMAGEDGHVEAIYKLDCTDALLPFAVLLFAGIRPEEFQKLTWDHVLLDEGFINVPPSIAKTREVRHVTIKDNLRRFFEAVPESDRKGLLRPTNWVRKAKIVRKAAGLQNRSDAARHSFASYSLAIDPNIDRLREDMGHAKGSDMLFKHYRAAVSKQAAEEYWQIGLEEM